MGIIDGILKGLATASVASFTTQYLLESTLKMPSTICTVGKGLAAMGGFLYYSRVWIQGYWWDRTYNPTENLNGKVAVVTGGTIGGLGFATAELLASMGCTTIILTCRTQAKGEQAMQKLKEQRRQQKSGKNNSNINFHCVYIDFLSNQSVRKGADTIRKLTDRLDFLILNAGIAKGQSPEIWQTNHVGPFLLSHELTPLLKRTAKKENPSSAVRVVSVSSGAHKKAAIHWNDPFTIDDTGLFSGPYGQSKLANIMHMRELQRQINDMNDNKTNPILCFPVTPGAAKTNLVSSKSSESSSLISWLGQLFLGFIMRTPKIGVQVIKMACLDRSIPGGSYLSNCYVKPTEGVNGCSNDEGQWKKLWELTERHISENRFP